MEHRCANCQCPSGQETGRACCGSVPQPPICAHEPQEEHRQEVIQSTAGFAGRDILDSQP